MSGRTPDGRRRPVGWKYPLDPARQARICRKLAADLRAEAAAGWGDVPMANGGGSRIGIPRTEAARLMDKQAERWDAEAKDGPLNVLDRERMGL